MIRRIHLTRSGALVRLRHQLERDSFPRIQMGLIVALTGAVGWLCSFGLLHAGVTRMALRYPLAMVGAYVAFLLLLWLWLRTRADDYGDGLDIVDAIPTPDLGDTMPSLSGGGGEFGGGGASSSFDNGGAEALSDAANPFEKVADVGGAADELAIPILVAILAIGLALASLYVVYLAPTLFAELLFDGVLSYGLYRHLRGADSRNWLETAFRRTVLPFALTAVFLVAVGAGLSAYAPDAHTIGAALHQSHRAAP